MKNIKVSDDLYAQLKEMAEEYFLQDNRATAYPLYFTIQEKIRHYGYSSSFANDYIWVHNEDGETYIEDKEYQELSKKEKKDYHKVYYVEKLTYKNVFLRESTIKKHIKLNHYHYSDPKTYVEHAWRNPDMEIIINLLKSINENES